MRTARVHIAMGSKSDEDAIRASGMVDILSEVLGDDDLYALSCSAHRDPERLAKYVKEACDSGAEVFIGIAGLAAALPGAVAGLSGMMKMVIGVPLDQYGVYSCLIMPPGVPVVTTGIGSADVAYQGLKNAAIEACQVLAIGDPKVRIALADYVVRTAKTPEFDIPIDRLKKPKKEA